MPPKGEQANLRGKSKRISRDQRLSELLNQLQLKESVEGNKELRKQLKDLQEKLDVLLVQLKKRNRRDYGNKTERHNPRPAREQKTVAPKEAPLRLTARAAKERNTSSPKTFVPR
ncbi:MAG: hypothetical protein K8F91_08430 [Candidatus Obscuribacterales bacterium]|nr:hypothetical protein [Candidatus Obscuribacterales bacterium]